MIRKSKNGLEILQFENPLFQDCSHGFLTRKGGVSTKPFDSLNQGSAGGDERSNVVENRKRAFSFFERPIESIFDVWQVHGTNVICSNEPRRLDAPHIKADAIFTDNPDITLFMRFADCVPILLYDPIVKVVGIVHAGWKGTVEDIIGCAIDKAGQQYGLKPDNLVAGIGPSIGPDHYFIGKEVLDKVETCFGKDSDRIVNESTNGLQLNLWSANEILLRKKGVKTIEKADICTACNLSDWFSYRAEGGKTGRFGALLALPREQA